jgi:hypothetical protein
MLWICGRQSETIQKNYQIYIHWQKLEKLAYPKTLALDSVNGDFYFKGGEDQLAERLVQLSEKIQNNNLWDGNPDRAIRIVEKFFWKAKARLLDKELIRVFLRK